MLTHMHEPQWSAVRKITRFDRFEVVMRNALCGQFIECTYFHVIFHT